METFDGDTSGIASRIVSTTERPKDGATKDRRLSHWTQLSISMGYVVLCSLPFRQCDKQEKEKPHEEQWYGKGKSL